MAKRQKEDLQDGMPRPVPLWMIVLETAGLAASVPLLGWWLNPGDPLFTRSNVSWSLFAPMLAGLRYGVAPGFGCAAALSFLAIGAWRAERLGVHEFPGTMAVGMLLAGMVAGEFAHVWSQRVRRLATIGAYQRQRFDEFARNYQLLKVSHDALEERSAGVGATLRNALVTTRAELLRVPQGDSSLRGRGRLVLDLFAAFGHVQVASILPVDKGRVQPAAASLGAMPDDLAGDPLVLEALRTGGVAGLDPSAEGDPRAPASPLAAAVPCVDVSGRIWAVVAIREIPFFAYTPETLRVLALVGATVADTLAFGTGILGAEPASMAAFDYRVNRCMEDARRRRVPASVVSFTIPKGASAARVLPRVMDDRRGLDQVVLLRGGGVEARMFVLLPLTDTEGVKGYLGRLDRLTRRLLGSSMEEAGLLVNAAAGLGTESATRILAELKGATGGARGGGDAARN